MSQIEAIHYAASAGTRIGKGKLGMINQEWGFGRPSSNMKRKGRLTWMMQG